MFAYKHIKDPNTLIKITKLLKNTKYISKIISKYKSKSIDFLKDSHLFNYTYTI